MGRYFDRISARFAAQEAKGIEKYGQPLEQNNGDFDYRLEHLAQELTDGLMYCEWLKEGGHVIMDMFILLVQDLENSGTCPLNQLCTVKPEGGCLECLSNHYEKKARERIIDIQE